jgi:hypothetical protein
MAIVLSFSYSCVPDFLKEADSTVIRCPPASAGGADFGMESTHRSTKMPKFVINNGKAIVDKIASPREMHSELDAALLLTLCRKSIDFTLTL